MIPCFITARTGSKRLKRKHFLPMSNDSIDVISHIVLRCLHFSFAPVVCVPTGDFDSFDHVPCPVFEGDAENVEARLIECAHQHNLEAFHHLDGDDPFFDEYAVVDSWNAAAMGLARVMPSYNSQSGTGRVGTTYNLRHKAQGTRNLADRLENYPWPQRLTLDYPEDYHLILAVDRIVGGYMAPRRAVDELFVRNSDLHKINWFHTPEWKERQRHENNSIRNR